METIKEAWSGILDYLHRQDDISEVAYNVWISCIEPRSIEDGEVVVYVHTQFQKKIIREHYAGKLCDAFLQVLGLPLGLTILSGEDDASSAAKIGETIPIPVIYSVRKVRIMNIPLKISWSGLPINSRTLPPRRWPANRPVIIILYLYMEAPASAKLTFCMPSAMRSNGTIPPCGSSIPRVRS